MSSSFLENYPFLMTAGPGPGVPVVQEIYPGMVHVRPLSFFGVSGTDGQWIRTACNYLLAQYQGGEVVLAPLQFNVTSTITVPEPVSLTGVPGATIINYGGTGAAISHHGSTDSFTPNFTTVGHVKGITIDGSNSGVNAIGLDVGDGWGHDVDVKIRHFNNTGGIGLYLNNNNTWSEKCRFRASVMDCSDLVVFDVTASGLPSHMYSEYDFMLFAQPNQDGVVIQGGSEPSRCFFQVRGNFFTSGVAQTGTCIRIVGTNSHLNQCQWMLGCEVDGNLAFAHQTFVLAGTGNTFSSCQGILAFLNVGASNWAAASLAGKWNFQGIVEGDSTLSHPAQPVMPTSGTVYTNTDSAAMVYVTGGTVTQISVNGVITGLTSGTFRLKANSDTIKITYSVVPSWVWIWELQ